ncbi:uncharacterized protein LOC144378022 isoform X8 [Ictidomys tridecemlineatus]
MNLILSPWCVHQTGKPEEDQPNSTSRLCCWWESSPEKLSDRAPKGLDGAGHLMLRGSGVVTLQVWQSEVLLTDGFHESHGGKCFVRVEEAALRT